MTIPISAFTTHRYIQPASRKGFNKGDMLFLNDMIILSGWDSVGTKLIMAKRGNTTTFSTTKYIYLVSLENERQICRDKGLENTCHKPEDILTNVTGQKL